MAKLKFLLFNHKTLKLHGFCAMQEAAVPGRALMAFGEIGNAIRMAQALRPETRQGRQ
jgi:hypothetical protein